MPTVLEIVGGWDVGDFPFQNDFPGNKGNSQSSQMPGPALFENSLVVGPIGSTATKSSKRSLR